MKLSKLFMMALLAGTLGVFGCSDDENNGGGTNGGGGSGGSGVTEPCTGGLCETADVKIDCEASNTVCKADANGDIGMTDAECDEAMTELYCVVGNPGTGGAGGDGGGGAGGASGVDGCDKELCLTEPDRKAACEEFMPWCIAYCDSAEGGLCGADECAGFALIFICREQV